VRGNVRSEGSITQKLRIPGNEQQQQQSSRMLDIVILLTQLYVANSQSWFNEFPSSSSSPSSSSIRMSSWMDLSRCTRTSLELASMVPPENRSDVPSALPACILYDEIPRLSNDYNINNDSNNGTSSPLITLVQVTPYQCREHRDGAYLAVMKLNDYQDQRGVPIGYYKNHHVRTFIG
jgi:hypothetical protein